MVSETAGAARSVRFSGVQVPAVGRSTGAEAVSEVWGLCPICNPMAPAVMPGRRKVILIKCSGCEREYRGSRPAPEGPKPNYLAMRHALRPLVEELERLHSDLDDVDGSEGSLKVAIAELLAQPDDEPRMRWLRQEARYTLGLDVRPTTGLRGRMQ